MTGRRKATAPDRSAVRPRLPGRARAGVAGALAMALVLATTGGSSAQPSPSPSPAASNDPALLWERDISPKTLAKPYPFDYDWDPIVATHPTDPMRIAVSYNALRSNSGSACTHLVIGLRITDDGGLHWHEAAGMPWKGSGRAPGWHAAIAWGPGPTAHAPARLYWADTTVPCDNTRHRLSIAYSDDEGAHWSKLFTYTKTAETDGGYPDITVDRDPASPNYGAVYAAINWFPNAATQPGLRLLASANFGATWKSVEVPPVGGLSSYPFKYRISYRLRTGPDGSLYVGFCQFDMRSYKGYYGRLGFAISRVTFNPGAGTFKVRKPHMVRTVSINRWSIGSAYAPGSTDPQRIAVKWTYGLDVDPDTGLVYMAVADYLASPASGTPHGRVYVGRSADKGKTWHWTTLPRLPNVRGRPQSEHKPTLTARGGKVFVGVHGIVDVPSRTSPAAGAATIGNYYAVSYDRGATFTRPAAISASRWNLEALMVTPTSVDTARNRAGLRDRAEFTADGDVVYVYGDGRKAMPEPNRTAGRSQIYAALISLGTKSP